MISHTDVEVRLDQAILERFSVLGLLHIRVERGDFSLVQGYLDALHWLFGRNIKFDWITNLTGECYPVQPLKTVESFLAETRFDAFVQHCNAFAELRDNVWGARARDAPGIYSRVMCEPDLIRMLHDVGYRRVSVLGKDRQNAHPHITVLA